MMNPRLSNRYCVLLALCLLWVTVWPGPRTVFGGVLNGDFSNPLDPYWTISSGGDVAVQNGQAVLSEGGTALPLLQQAFTIPAGASVLRFEIAALDLRPNSPTEPGDAFEVHLVGADGASLMAALPLGDTTALLNYQQTGELYYAQGVTVSGAPESGAAWLPGSFPVAVTIVFDPMPENDIDATLIFAIVGGEGEQASSVAVDNIVMVANPVAVDDTASATEDTPVQISVLSNDSDPDGGLDPSTVTVSAAPSHGEITVDSQTGIITYSPAPDFNGVDVFSYTVSDDAGNLSNAAVVTVSVLSVNDPPIARAGPDQAVAEGSIVTLDGSGSIDPEGDIASYQWTVVSTADLDEGQAVVVLDPAAAATTFSAPLVGIGDGRVTVRLTVTESVQGGALSHSDELTVTVLNTVIPGDVDDSGAVNLDDLIILLKLLSLHPLTGVDITGRADVSGDGALGSPEACYILRHLAGP